MPGGGVLSVHKEGVPLCRAPQRSPNPGPGTGSPLHHRGSGCLLWWERDPVLGPELWGSAPYKEPCKSGPRNGSPPHYTGTPVTLAPALDPSPSYREDPDPSTWPPQLYQAPSSWPQHWIPSPSHRDDPDPSTWSPLPTESPTSDM